MLKNISRCPGYQQTTEIPRFDFLKQVRVLLTCHVVLDAMNEQFIVCIHVFDSLAVKMTNLGQRAPVKVRVIVTST